MPLIPIPEDRAAWLAMRRQYIGGSEIGSLYPEHKAAYQPSLLAVHHVKAGTIEADAIDDESDRMLLGRCLEGGVERASVEKWGYQTERPLYAINDACPGSASTPDVFITEPTQAELLLGYSGPGLMQIKLVDGLQYRNTWDGEPPAHIVLQVHKEMWDAGRDWGVVVALIGGSKLERWHYARDAELEADMARRITAFWAGVRERREPPIDGDKSTTAALKAMFPKLRPAVEVLDLRAHPGMDKIVDAYVKQKALEKAAAGAKAEAYNEMLSLAGSFRKVALPKGGMLNISVTPAKEPVTITQEMVGTKLPGRKESRRATLTGYGDDDG